MIEYKKGNICDITCGVIAHGCNAQGVMGAGVAKALKDKYPRVFYSYGEHYQYYPQDLLGTVDLCKINDDLYVANCITQEYYGRAPEIQYVSYEAVSSCFQSLRASLAKHNKHYEIHIPKLGAGLGGGNWEIIAGIIQVAMPNHKFICWEL